MTDRASKKIPSPLGELRRRKNLKVEDIIQYFSSKDAKITKNAVYWWEQGLKEPVNWSERGHYPGRSDNKRLYAEALGITEEQLDKLLKQTQRVKRLRQEMRGGSSTSSNSDIPEE